MKPPTLNIDREKCLITITRRFQLTAMDTSHELVETLNFTIPDAIVYIETLAKGLTKLSTTPTPSGPKPN